MGVSLLFFNTASFYPFKGTKYIESFFNPMIIVGDY